MNPLTFETKELLKIVDLSNGKFTKVTHIEQNFYFTFS